MKSKRTPFIVITDDYLTTDMHFFSDGTKGLIIQCKKADLLKLLKQVDKKQSKKLKETGRFVHLSPEISFFIK